MNAIVAIMRAADFAAHKHVDQRRKDGEAEPYLNHLIEVASLVAEATDGDPDAVIAALLHDAVEDQGVTDAEIADLFGPTAASLVAEVTDDKSLPKQVRKDMQIAGASHKSDGASVIKLADKTGNLLAVHAYCLQQEASGRLGRSKRFEAPSTPMKISTSRISPVVGSAIPIRLPE